MVSIEEKVRAEIENITTVLTEIERVKDMPQKERQVGLIAHLLMGQ